MELVRRDFESIVRASLTNTWEKDKSYLALGKEGDSLEIII